MTDAVGASMDVADTQVAETHVAVLGGGWSNEREISRVTAKACAKALRDRGYRVTEIDVDRSIAATLVELRPDVAFNGLHGTVGEDGTIQGILEVLQIPYTHSGVLASALAMDKHRAKAVFGAVGIPVAEHLIADRRAVARDHVMDPPYVVKPIAEGSSVNIFVVKKGTEHPPQEILKEDWTGGDEVMVERFVPGRELTSAVIGEQVLAVTEIVTDLPFYNYEAKYSEGGSKHLIPAPISSNIYQRVQTLTLMAHRALGCRGVTRTDFRLHEKPEGESELVCLELNTQPGMTPTSLVPELAALAGYSFEQLVAWMLEDASCNR